VEKKAAFQRQARIELGLANFTVENRRVEDLPAGGFDAVISRAFAELARFRAARWTSAGFQAACCWQ
jgi:16S rRNA (guanine527-N7)-methyltransferase